MQFAYAVSVSSRHVGVAYANQAAERVPTDVMPSPELYFDTIVAFHRSAALKSAIDLDLFTAIADGAHTRTRCQARTR